MLPFLTNDVMGGFVNCISIVLFSYTNEIVDIRRVVKYFSQVLLTNTHKLVKNLWT